MVEKERQRLEVLKRRQEKELQQMVQYEITRKVGGGWRGGALLQPEQQLPAPQQLMGVLHAA